ncbi:MAG: D-alanine--D-alanine ligase [Rickettsiales bacterium]|nr:D-alanine--D-alanine ligase [Rickettsiales bacterium]
MDLLKKYKKISILQGGISDESEISLLSAQEVYKALKNKYDVTLIDVNRDCTKLISDIKKSKPDIIFNCLHGYFGEDGQIQSILNYLQIPYTHSGVLASSILMNKHFSKILFEKLGVETPMGNLIANINLEKTIKFPLIVKPICGGSSNQLYKINDNGELNSFLNKKQQFLEKFMYEKFIPGRELTVGILDNKVCGVMEIIFDDEIYDYNNKYLKIAKHEINPKLPKKILNMLKSISENVHNKMDCNCVSRLDFRYSAENEKIFLLEVNTQPGLTKNSLLPEMAASKGLNFLELCEIILSNPECVNF